MKITRLQLANITDGRFCTEMEDIYSILNYVTDSDLFTHHLPVAKSYLEEKNPDWFEKEKQFLRDLFNVQNTKDIEFGEFFKKVSENNDEIEIFPIEDLSDFGDYMVKNSLLLNR